MTSSARAVVGSPFRALLTAVVLTTLLSPHLVQCCYSESYSWDESHNPLGPSRCRSSNNSCDCDGLRTCSFWGYCQGAARAASRDSASPGLATTMPPLSIQLGSSLEESHNDSGGISSDGIRRLIIIPIAIFGTVFGLGGLILLSYLCCNCCTRSMGPQQVSSYPSMQEGEGGDRLSSSAGGGITAGSKNVHIVVNPMCTQKGGLKQQEQQQAQQQLRKVSLQEIGCCAPAPAVPPLSLQQQSPQSINPVYPSSVTVECSSNNGTPISMMADVGTTGNGDGSNGGGLMKLHGLQYHRIGGPESPVPTPSTANSIPVTEAPSTIAESRETHMRIDVAPRNIQ
ncbi:hypothetical protein VaNZ11_013993 [Volvox africanus]|uniref:Scytovirin-like domain-containing protein n=1 Tax=Volvox africanus TaxID=51714 RepID=A0ABQ5SHN9_9CHLO|nr:hypothetical protein VaNZ11_013993 [Volvox africanus]